MVDVRTAEHHGICPTCEAYMGNDEPGCVNGDCMGSCPACWCPGCHDGRDYPADVSARCEAYGMPLEEWGGSWLAYQYVQELARV